MPRERRPENETGIIDDPDIESSPRSSYSPYDDPDIDSLPSEESTRRPVHERSDGFQKLYARAIRWGNTEKAAYQYAETHEPRDTEV